jgi:hypothetical protein
MNSAKEKIDYKVQMFGSERCYLNGWFTYEEIQEIVRTVENIRMVEKTKEPEDFTQNKTSG